MHLYAYLAVALAFAHQLAVGTDFSSDALARAWWVALYVAVLAAIVLGGSARPLWFNARHRLRIHRYGPRPTASCRSTSAAATSGRRCRAGQFFLWRFLTGSGWAKAHPFSLSAAPNDRFLRITVKAPRRRHAHVMQSLSRAFVSSPKAVRNLHRAGVGAGGG